MRSLKWLSKIGLSLLILSFFVSSDVAADDASGRAEALANKTQQRYGSADRLDQSVINPMMSGSAPLSNVEGSISSHVAIACKATDQFLEISVNPGPTGDLSLQASLDRNMNGSKSVYRPPFPVSGICANGVIACDPGTWNNCRSLMWQSSLEKISLSEVPSSRLGGCSCINNSCGANLFRQNISRVLGDIGGGIVGAVQEKNPSLAITDVKVVGDSLVYFGQDNEQCRSGEKASSLSSLYKDSNGLNQPLDNLTGSMDSKKYAGLVTSTAKDHGYTEKTCSIQRDYSIQTVTQFCEQPVPHGAIGSKEETQWMAVKTGSGLTIRNDCIFAQDLLLPSGTSVVPAVPTGAVSLGDRYVVTRCQKKRKKDRATYDVYAYYSRCQRKTDIKTETQSDSCAAISAGTGCTVKDETIDGIQVVRAHYQTGNAVSTTCRTFTGGVANFTECNPRWRTDRVYSCQSDKKSYNFSEGQMESLIGSVSGDGESLTYQSQRDGVLETRSILMPKQELVSSCVSACKTKKIVTQTDVIPDAGHAGQYRTDVQREETHYKTCSPTCPLGGGETLVKDCQCLNSFAEAATMMSVLNAAGEDLICAGSKY
jgi:hypothetical protein